MEFYTGGGGRLGMREPDFKTAWVSPANWPTPKYLHYVNTQNHFKHRVIIWLYELNYFPGWEGVDGIAHISPEDSIELQ